MKTPKYLLTAKRSFDLGGVNLIAEIETDEELLTRINKLESSGHDVQVYKLELLDSIDLQDINNDLERNDPEAFERVCQG